MKKSLILGFIVDILIIGLFFYVVLPPINLQAAEFWLFFFISFAIFLVTYLLLRVKREIISVRRRGVLARVFSIGGKGVGIGFLVVTGIFISILIINFFLSPIFNARSYSKRIVVDESGEFSKDIEPVDFKMLPLLDRDSSEKLGDRVMGQMSELVSQFKVSDDYTQINYNNDIIRVTPLEYADFIKWISNRKGGVKGYITVNSVNGDTKLVKLNKGMRFMPSAYFNENLYRHLRFKYLTTNFLDARFEIDNEGNPYWIIPTVSYTGVNLKTKVTGVVICDPITGSSKKYPIDKVPTWVDNAYNANLIIEQLDDWGTYKKGFLNSLFGQKNVVNTTDGYNYLAMNDDVYLYTGITSVLADESNLGFVLSNMRTGKTFFYSAPGAEEYSAMASAEGQVQQMNYRSTFPLLINLNSKPTYLVSLKDAAGLVKMYGFIDVADYQKVVVTDAAKGINVAAENYLNNYADEISEDMVTKKEIKIKKITSAIKAGTTNYYIVDENDNKYVVSINVNEDLPFISSGDKITIGYFNKNQKITTIEKIY